MKRWTVMGVAGLVLAAGVVALLKMAAALPKLTQERAAAREREEAEISKFRERLAAMEKAAEQRAQERSAILVRHAEEIEAMHENLGSDGKPSATLPPASPLVQPLGRKSLDLGGGMRLDLVLVPQGEFTMGSPDSEEGRESHEGPAHKVRIARPFWMGAWEVTQEQYQAVIGTNPSADILAARNPVESVSWHEAQEFCRRVSEKTGQSVRLPTEAEWEYACRAGSTTPFYFGETISTDQANYDGRETYGKGSRGKHRIRTMPGASFPANAWGLCEMHGNAWEWCQSLDREYPYRADDGREDLKAQGRRVLRGGSWTEEPKGCRSASRNPADPHDRCINVGFRVVVE